jgi:hypothetical protein
MILLLSVFITSKRSYENRYSRLDIFKYTLKSYKRIPFTEVYLYILLDNELLHFDMETFVKETFSHLPEDKIHYMNTRYDSQENWRPVIQTLMDKHGANESVWFTQNDDHVFIDDSLDMLTEGLTHLENDPSRHKTLYFSHWPEIIRFSGKYGTQSLVSNYIKFNITNLDSIQIFNLQYLYDIFITHKWKQNQNRIDFLINEITNEFECIDPLQQTIYAPLKEMCRHFDGYDHVCMDRSACPRLELPSNTFDYSPETLLKKMTAPHYSFWTQNNTFAIPQEWFDINLKLHKIPSYTV